MDILEGLAFILVVCPLVGMLTALAGWTVGEVINKMDSGAWQMLSKYGHLTALGFGVYVVHSMVSGG